MKATNLIKALQEIGFALEKKATERADAERTAFQISVDEMRDHMNDLTDQLNEHTRCAADPDEVEDLKGSVAEHEERIEELEGQDIEQMARQIEDLEEKVENQEREMERMSEALSEALESAERQIEDLEEKVSAMLRALTRAGSALNNLTDEE